MNVCRAKLSRTRASNSGSCGVKAVVMSVRHHPKRVSRRVFLERSYFREPALEPLQSFEPGAEEGGHERLGLRRCDDAATQAQYVHRVVFHALARGVDLVT